MLAGPYQQPLEQLSNSSVISSVREVVVHFFLGLKIFKILIITYGEKLLNGD